MVTTGLVRTSDGTDVSISADSVCVHGDSANAVEMAGALRQALAAAGVGIHPFAL